MTEDEACLQTDLILRENAMQAAAFLLKHGIAAAIAVVGCVALVTISYFGLLLWAILTNGGLGGPLALPGMVLFVLAGAIGSVVMVLLPVTAIAEVLRVKARMNRLAELPIASLVLAAYVAGAFGVIAAVRGWPVETTLRAGVALVVLQLLLLGVYWWALQATHGILSLVSNVWRRLARATAAVPS